MKKLEGKIAIITGGSRGIGKAVAKAFLENGACVMISARSVDELAAAKAELAATGGIVEYFPADVSKKADVKALFAQTAKTFGEPNVVVNAAGGYGAIGGAEVVDLEQWKKTFEINTFGTFSVIQEAIPVVAKSGRGKIINFSGGGDGPLPYFSAYSASKVVIPRLTETLAEELKDRNIDINAVAPGAVNTKILEDGLAAEKLVSKEAYARLLKQKEEGGVPPEKAAELCVFLASSDSDGLSGKLVSAVWDKWQSWTKDDIAKLMKEKTLLMRRVNPQ